MGAVTMTYGSPKAIINMLSGYGRSLLPFAILTGDWLTGVRLMLLVRVRVSWRI